MSTTTVPKINSKSKQFFEIPEELKSAPWVLWSAVPKKDKPREFTKVPFQPCGQPASVSDPKTWSSFETALESAPKFDGIGFVNTPDSPWTVLDVDDAIDGGKLEPSALELLARFETYTEISPSGLGLRIILRGRLKSTGTDKKTFDDGAIVEIFHGAHYFTITGNIYKDRGAIEDCTEQLKVFLLQNGKEETTEQKRTASVTQTYIPMTRALDIARRYYDYDDYSQWVEIGQILKASYGDEERSFSAWCEWSQQSVKYPGEEASRKKWKSFRRNEKTVGSLVHREQKMLERNIFRVLPGGIAFKTGGNLSPSVCASLGSATALGDLKRLSEAGHNELLKPAFLKRGGGLILNGNTGIGKSSLAVQAGMCWALNREFFGIAPSGPLRVLNLQAENDESEIAEIRDGILHHLKLSAEELATVQERVMFVFDSGHAGAKFGPFLDEKLRENPCDIVFIDPALAYLGGETSSQKDVSEFLRNTIDPIIKQHEVGAFINQHTSKPSRGPEKDGWSAGEFSYSSLGSVEWANWPRAVLFLRNIGFQDMFELMVPKRGGRLGWKDASGNPTVSRHIIQNRTEVDSDGSPFIYWREAETEDLQRIVVKSNSNGSSRECRDPEVLALAILPHLEGKAVCKDEFGALCSTHLKNVGRDKANEIRAVLVRDHGFQERLAPGRHGKKFIGFEEPLNRKMNSLAQEIIEGS